MQEYPEDPTRYCNEMIGARRRRVPRWSSEQRLWEKIVQQKVFCALKAISEDLSNACKDGKMSCCRITKLKGCDRRWKAKTPKRVGVGGAIKHKGIEASNIENEMKNYEECTVTFSFYVISGSDLSQVHMVVENLGATGDILDEGGWGCLMTTSEDISDRRCEDHDMSPCSDRLMTTGRDTSYRRCEDHDMSPCSDRLMTTCEDTSGEGVRTMVWVQDSDRLIMTDGDTSDGRCVGQD